MFVKRAIQKNLRQREANTDDATCETTPTCVGTPPESSRKLWMSRGSSDVNEKTSNAIVSIGTLKNDECPVQDVYNEKVISLETSIEEKYHFKKRCKEIEASNSSKSVDGSEEVFAGIYKPRKVMRIVGMTAGGTKKEKKDVMDGRYFHSDLNPNLDHDNRATFLMEVDTETTKDHRHIMERKRLISDAIKGGELKSGIYRGEGAILNAVSHRESAESMNRYTGLYGPIRGSSNIRTTLRVDYNPERCKDYFDTGYCGWGDTCKFMHDRTDYKEGWKIDLEWEKEQKRKTEEQRRKALQKEVSSDSE